MEIVKDRILNHYKAKAVFGELYIAYRSDNNHFIGDSFTHALFRSTIENDIEHTFKGRFTSANGRTEDIEIGVSLSRNSEPRNTFKVYHFFW